MNVLHYPVVPLINGEQPIGYIVVNPFSGADVFLSNSQFELFKTLVIKMNKDNEDTSLLHKNFLKKRASRFI